MNNPFQAARFLMSAAQLAQLPAPDRPEAAFAGRSNAGKSSALNALCGQNRLARVSKTPGRTQLINFFELSGEHGLRLRGRLADLPGYGFAQVPLAVKRDWGRLVSGYIESRECLRGIVLVMDARHPLTDFDRQMLAWAQGQSLDCHLLLTKSDKLAPNAARATLSTVQKEMPQHSAQLFSSLERTGVEQARAVIAQWLRADTAP